MPRGSSYHKHERASDGDDVKSRNGNDQHDGAPDNDDERADGGGDADNDADRARRRRGKSGGSDKKPKSARCACDDAFAHSLCARVTVHPTSIQSASHEQQPPRRRLAIKDECDQDQHDSGYTVNEYTDITDNARSDIKHREDEERHADSEHVGSARRASHDGQRGFVGVEQV
jgi:hypothetical protein